LNLVPQTVPIGSVHVARPGGRVGGVFARAVVACTLATALVASPHHASAQEAATDESEPVAENVTPFDEQPYRIKLLVSFSNDPRMTGQLRGDVLRRFNSHAAAFVGDAWQLDVQDVSGSLNVFTSEAMSSLAATQFEQMVDGQDKVFVLGVRSTGDSFAMVGREYDVFFDRWSPLFQGSARETTQIARELILIASRMFAPLARLVTGDAKRATIEFKGGRLPTLDPAAIHAKSRYKPAFQFAPNGTILRPMRAVFNEEDQEVIERMEPVRWTWYVVEGRDGAEVSCRIASAIRGTLPYRTEDPNEPEIIVARTAGGSTILRVVDNENRAALAGMDVEVRERTDGASFPLGTTDSEGRIQIAPRGAPAVLFVYIRHGQDLLAMLPVLPGAGTEPEQTVRADALRLDIEGRVVALQAYIVDQVARRTILSGARDPVTQVMKGGLIRKAIEKKDIKQAESLLKQFAEAPDQEALKKRLDSTKEYLRSLREEAKWSNKVKRLFGTTDQIIEAYFNPDELADIRDEFKDDIQSLKEDAANAAADGQPDATPAAAAAGSGS
jgi:hypothetical protein